PRPPLSWMKPLLAGALVLFLAYGCATPRQGIYLKREGVYHKVERGQTLWRICYTYGVDIQEVAELNDIKDPTFIKVGQRIFIPGRSKVKKVIPYIPPEETKRHYKKVTTYKGKFAWPVKGKLISPYGMRGGDMHKGIDIKAPKGTPIKASAAGKVVHSDNKMRGYGNMVIVKHPDDFFTVYAHNDKNLVKVGDSVKKGATIARVGDTGRASTYHLHFEVRVEKKTRNPLFFLP
ncbi:MAG: LysM peptidoglycan-binding domain-containing M23 family metallopeptidase, partial [Thermodesulfobacteriota bacterium]